MADTAPRQPTPPAHPPSASRSPLVALRYPNFRVYWLGQLVSIAGSTMQQAAVAWQVYTLSHSAIALGLIGLVRVAPIVVFSLGGGVVADAINRRRLLLVTQSILLCVSAVLAVATISGGITVWMIYILTATAAATLAFDSPARQAFVPSLIPRDHLPNALSLNSTMFQGANVIGPSLAGILIASGGVASVYVIDAVSYVAVIIALLVINPPATEGETPKISLDAAVDGLRFMRNTPILLSTMALDFAATFFSSATALLPIFARDILHVGSLGYGLLYASPAMGAILAGIAMAAYGGVIRRQGHIILIAVIIYGACTVAFGLSRVFPISMLALAGTGAADTVSMVLRQTVRQLVTPDALRGRMTSVSMIFFMGGPQLGEFEAGVVARLFGAQASVVTGGVGALIATTIISWYAVGLRQYQH